MQRKSSPASPYVQYEKKVFLDYIKYVEKTDPMNFCNSTIFNTALEKSIDGFFFVNVSFFREFLSLSNLCGKNILFVKKMRRNKN